MAFSPKQARALQRPLRPEYIRTRQAHGRELSFIEGWHAIAEANRIFGVDGWNRETVESRCVFSRETRGTFAAVYVAKVRVTVRAGGETVVREGHGTGEGRSTSPGETHDIALKGAETDATKRALATFGRPLGLSLYLTAKQTSRAHAESTRGVGQMAIIGPAALPTPTPLPQEAERPTEPWMVTPKRYRNKAHLKFVAAQPCLLCGRLPSDAHHLRFAQPRALALKVSDEFTVPLCRGHHRQVHHAGNEADWWNDLEIDALEIAKALWQESRRLVPLPDGAPSPTLTESAEDEHGPGRSERAVEGV